MIHPVYVCIIIFVKIYNVDYIKIYRYIHILYFHVFIEKEIFLLYYVLYIYNKQKFVYIQRK